MPSLSRLLCFALGAGATSSGFLDTRQSSNNTVSNSNLQTWWHNTGQTNTQTAVAPGDVRQSHKYSVQVQTTGDSTYYDSFVYETIPRNGLGPTSDPNNLNTANSNSDGITIEQDIGTSMAWSSFLYTTGVNVKVHRTDGKSIDVNSVTIRPTTLQYAKSLDSNGDLVIGVPYISTGTKFSVEFADDLYSYHNRDGSTTSTFVQTNNTGDAYYVPSFTSSMPVMGVEPLNSLLIFASPFESADMVPDQNAPTTYVGRGGQVDTNALKTVTNTALYFAPGVHYCGGQSQMELSNSISWVYFAPGAYVKCALVYGEPGTNGSTQFKATGHGVLSGEQYVFQADPANNFLTRTDSSHEPVRMWRGTSTNNLQQYFVLNGPTVNAPPFQSMDFTGDLNTLSCYVNDYKMVGAFFGETDGLENYMGSRVADVFYHSNDDTIKMYYGNTSVQRVTVWKGTTAPVIQFGWHSYNLNSILVDTVNTIHARWNRNDSHPSVIGANQDYRYYPAHDDWTNTSDVSNTAQNVQFSNIRVEGIGGSLMRICPLETFRDFTISNVSIEQRAVNSSFIPVSEFSYFTDASQKSGVGVNNFKIENFSVGGVKVSTAANNWNSSSLGGLNIASQYLNADGITIV